MSLRSYTRLAVALGIITVDKCFAPAGGGAALPEPRSQSPFVLFIAENP